jgi:hypothetical protein
MDAEPQWEGRRRFPRRVLVWAGVVLLPVLAVVVVLIRGAVLESRLARRKAELRAAGLPASMEDVVERRNADAFGVLAAQGLLATLGPLGSGYADAVSAPLGVRHSDEIRKAVVAQIEAVSGLVADMTRSLDGVSGFPIDPEDPAYDAGMPHVWRLLGASRTLAAFARTRAEMGDTKRAAEGLATGLRLADSVGEEPLVQERVLAANMDAEAVDAIEDAVSVAEFPAAELARLRGLLGRTPPSPAASLTAERAWLFSTLQNLSAAEMESDDGERLHPGLRLRLAMPGWCAGEALLFDEMVEELLAACRADLRERRRALRRLPERLNAAPDGGPWTWSAAASTARYCARCVEATVEHEALLRVAATALAVEQWRVEHGEWPESLEQLVPGLLEEVPEDPYSEDKLVYRRTGDGVVVYSVGPDGAEDGGVRLGELTGQYGALLRSGWDLPFRLLDRDRRGAVTLSFREDVMASELSLDALQHLGFDKERLRELGLTEEDLAQVPEW